MNFHWKAKALHCFSSSKMLILFFKKIYTYADTLYSNPESGHWHWHHMRVSVSRNKYIYREYFVRKKQTHFDICSLRGFVSIPIFFHLSQSTFYLGSTIKLNFSIKKKLGFGVSMAENLNFFQFLRYAIYFIWQFGKCFFFFPRKAKRISTFYG